MVLLVGIVAGSIASLFVSDNNEANGDANDAADDDSIDEVAESLLSFSPNVFFVALLPPIIFNSGYHLRRGKSFFSRDQPLIFAILLTFLFYHVLRV